MSAPDKRASNSIARRLRLILDEYDDSAYALIIKNQDCGWTVLTRATPEQKVVMARALIEQAIDTWFQSHNYR